MHFLLHPPYFFLSGVVYSSLFKRFGKLLYIVRKAWKYSHGVDDGVFAFTSSCRARTFCSLSPLRQVTTTRLSWSLLGESFGSLAAAQGVEGPLAS